MRHSKQSRIAYVAGDTIAGVRILGIRTASAANGNSEANYVQFHCQTPSCGKRTEALNIACTQWVNKQQLWVCADCRKARKLAYGQSRRTLIASLKSCNVPEEDQRTGTWMGKQMVFMTVNCTRCKVRFEDTSKALRVMENNQGIRCPECRKKSRRAAKNRWQNTFTETIGGFSSKTLAMWERLSPKIRAAAEAIVRRHQAASRANGCPPENMERVYVEAVEIARMELAEPVPEPAVYAPFRRYPQYIPPCAD